MKKFLVQVLKIIEKGIFLYLEIFFTILLKDKSEKQSIEKHPSGFIKKPYLRFVLFWIFYFIFNKPFLKGFTLSYRFYKQISTLFTILIKHVCFMFIFVCMYYIYSVLLISIAFKNSLRLFYPWKKENLPFRECQKYTRGWEKVWNLHDWQSRAAIYNLNEMKVRNYIRKK